MSRLLGKLQHLYRLWPVLLIAVALLVGLFAVVFGDGTEAFMSGASGLPPPEVGATVEPATLDPAWEDIPNNTPPGSYGPEADARLARTAPPRPGAGEPIVAERLANGGTHYRVEYKDGSVYDATVRPDGSASFEYRRASNKWKNFVGAAIAAFISGVAIAGLFHVLSRLAGHDPDAFSLATNTSTNHFEAVLLERWLRRSRYYRFVGGFMGLIVGCGVSMERNGYIEISAAFVATILGIAAGGAFAELHVLRRDRDTVSVADLSVRSRSDYTTLLDRVATLLIAGIAMLITTGVVFGLLDSRTLRGAVGALLVVLVVAVTQYLVAARSRPALQPELRRADDLLRRLAATQGFARPGIAGGFFLLAAAVQVPGGATWSELMSFALIFVGFVWLAIGQQRRIPNFAKKAT